MRVVRKVFSAKCAYNYLYVLAVKVIIYGGNNDNVHSVAQSVHSRNSDQNVIITITRLCNVLYFFTAVKR